MLDEAYADFASENGLKLLQHRPNLIVTRTLSKSYSRSQGFASGSPSHSPMWFANSVEGEGLLQLRRACSLQSLQPRVIEDQEYFQTVRAKIIATRERMQPALTELGFDVTPSHANFVWCRSDRPASRSTRN
ncbi:MAG: aminotransferase class I/II-fold pyridoxal phosphate-dependent enzyme [Gemmataceae bacterium]